MERGSSSKDQDNSTALLKVICGTEVGRVYTLRGTEVIIGRIPGIDVQIKSRSVSRMHCKLVYSSGRWSVVDMGSQNGTYVNEKSLPSNSSVLLNHHDIIHLGPPSEEAETLHFYDCNSTDKQIMVYPQSVSQVMHTRSKKEKENFLVETKSSSSSLGSVLRKCKTSDAKNVCVTKSRKRKRTVEPADVELCTNDIEQNGEFSKNKYKCSPSDKELLNTSTSSLESLRTRISKSTDGKRKKKKNGSESSTYDGSFCQDTDKACKNESDSSGKNLPASVKCVLDEVFLEDDNSQSLLTTGSDFLIGSDPYLVDDNPVSKLLDESCVKSITEDLEELAVSRKSSELILKNQITLLQERVSKLEKERSDLEKKIVQNKKLLEKHRSKEKKQEEHIHELERTIKEEINSQITKRIEEELMCNICTEIFIKATVLECSHTFCEHCICEWKKKKKQCPICRAAIKSETKVLILDHFIDKILGFINPSAKEKRKEILDKREELKSASKANASRRPVQRRGRRRRTSGPNRRTSPVPVPVQNPPFEDYEGEEEVQILNTPNVIQELFDFLSVDWEDMSSDHSESPVEGYGYYPGYGRCFNCGRTGHWANGCPENI